MKYFLLMLAFVTTLSFSGCLSFKPGSVRSGKKLYEAFYVGQQGTQYFIKPLLFESADTDEEFYIDFTFRYHQNHTGEVNINYTLLGNELVREVDALELKSKFSSIVSEDNHLLFNDKVRKNFSSRYSAIIELAELNSIMQEDYWEVIITRNGNLHSFIPARKTKKALKRLRENVFVLID